MTAIIPVNNREVFISHAIDSVLEQSTPPLEVIVVDDGSTDGTPQILRGYGDRITVITQQRRGRSFARNVAVQAARGSTIAFLDSDDRWHADKLTRQLEILENVGSAFITGYVRVVDVEGREIVSATQEMRKRLDRTRAGAFNLQSLILQPAIYTSSWLVPKDLLTEVGMFDEDLHALEDWDLLLRLSRKTRIESVEWPPLIDYRIHGGNTQSEAMAHAAVELINKHFADPATPDTAKGALQLVLARNLRSLLDQSGARSACKTVVKVNPGLLLCKEWWRLTGGALLPRSLASWTRSARSRHPKRGAG